MESRYIAAIIHIVFRFFCYRLNRVCSMRRFFYIFILYSSKNKKIKLFRFFFVLYLIRKTMTLPATQREERLRAKREVRHVAILAVLAGLGYFYDS